MKELLKRGANINTPSKSILKKDSRTPLMEASKKGHLEAVKFLLDKGAEINTVINGLSALDYASEGIKANEKAQLIYFGEPKKTYNMEIFNELLSRGISIDVGSPLYTAAKYENEKAVKELLKRGANVNKVDYYGDSPLHAAAKNVNLKIVKDLLEAGADVNKINEYGDSPLHKAIYSNYPNRMTKISSNELDRKLDRELKLVKELVSRGADVNKKDGSGMTRLDIAYKKIPNNKRVIRYLEKQKKILDKK